MHIFDEVAEQGICSYLGPKPWKQNILYCLYNQVQNQTQGEF
jgi:hypothetical protein